MAHMHKKYTDMCARHIDQVCLCWRMSQILSWTFDSCQIVTLDYTWQCQVYSPPGGFLRNSPPFPSRLSLTCVITWQSADLGNTVSAACQKKTGQPELQRTGWGSVNPLLKHCSLIPEASATEMNESNFWYKST